MKIEPLNFKTYLSFIKNSANSKSFQSLFAQVDGLEKDITKKGKLSCAFFTSSVLKIFSQIKNLHATVSGIIKDLEKSGWKEIKIPQKGSILIWESKNGHRHIGFYLGNNKAISNNSQKRTPQIHHYTFNNKRKIESIFHKNFS